MSKTSYSRQEVLNEIASTIKEKIAEHEASIEAMRKKELERSHGKLAKSESLCPLCAEVDVNGKCGCLSKAEVRKNDFITGAKHTQGYNAKVSFGPKATHSSGTDSMMATSPKDEPAAYGGSVKGSPAHNAMQHLPTKPAPKPINITKEEMSTSYASQAGVSHGDKGGKAAYGDGPHDQRPAMHQSNFGSMNGRNDKKPPIGKAPMKKDEMDGSGDSSMVMSELCLKCGKKNSLCKCMGKKEVQLDKGEEKPFSWPKDSKPGDLPGGGNIYEKGKKLGKAAMASSSASALAPKPEPMTAPSHVNKELGGFKSVASKPSISSMGRQKASASGSFTTVKGEMSPKYSEKVGISTDPEAKTTGHGLEPWPQHRMGRHNGDFDRKVPKVKGQQVKKGPALKKSDVPSVKQPAVVGTAGKQPVGLGGGDAGKAAGTPHPATTAGLADVKGLSPKGQWKGQGLPQLQNKLAAVRGGVSWLKATHAKASRVHPSQAAPKSQRFHGALPLQRAEKEPAKKAEMPAPTEGLSSQNHNRRMLKA